jgi:hypothetical protein
MRAEEHKVRHAQYTADLAQLRSLAAEHEAATIAKLQTNAVHLPLLL